MIDTQARRTVTFFLLGLLAMAAAVNAICAAEPPADTQGGGGRLDLNDGGFVVGRLMASDRPDSIRWQADGFAEPLDFTFDAVRHIALEPVEDEGGRSLRDRTETGGTPTGGAVGDEGGRLLRDRTETGDTPTGGAVGDEGGRSLRDRTETGGTPTGGAVGDEGGRSLRDRTETGGTPTGGAVGDEGGRSLRDRTETGGTPTGGAVGDEGGRSLRDRSETGGTPTGGAVGDEGGRSLRDRTETGGTQTDGTPTGGAVGDTAAGDAGPEFACVLVSGGCIYGRLLGLSADAVTLQTASGQHLQIERARVTRLVRAAAGLRSAQRTSKEDPGRSTPWQFDLTGKAWEPGVEALEHAGVGAPSNSGEFIDLDLASQCVLELDIAWKGKPQFELALGIEHTHESLQRAIRLAVWDGELVLFREQDSTLHLDVVLTASELSKLDQLQLKLYLDLAAGRVVVRQQSGESLAEFSAPAGQEPRGTGVRSFVGAATQVLQLTATSLSWGDLPGASSGSESTRVVLRSGDELEGAIERLDEATQQVVLQQPSGARSIALGDIHQLVLTARAEPQAAAVAAEPLAAPRFQIVTADGWHLQGEWLGVNAEHLRLQVDGIDAPVAVPLTRLQSISQTRRAAIASSALKPSRTGQLITERLSLRGQIANSDSEVTEPQLRWHPDGSLNSAPLNLPIDGEIVYRSARPPLDAIAATQEVNVRRRGGLGGALLQLFGGPAQPVRQNRVVVPQGEIVKGNPAALPAASSQATLFLRTGDTVTCEIQAIDEQGVQFSSPAVEQGLARHDQVKTVILAPLIRPKQISEATRERLLMVPRGRRDDPPTHLICSRTGDFLRGRLISLDDTTLRLETRLETREIPRDRVAQIFWLHPQATAESAPETLGTGTQDAGSATQRVQALRLDGTRMTFDFLACRDDSVFVGHSDLLGECQVDALQLERLLLGSAVNRSADDSPLALWRLHDAPIPKAFLPGAEGSGGGSGTESALVGKPAPQFELELLSGEKFRLADSGGRVVVLDFWASWCGPCIQAMPQIEEVVSEFPQDQVQLIAVNLQEPAETIQAALERMGLEQVAVALDHSGSVAEQYGVTAIPQTVIVGPSGDVARLYVGISSSSASDMHAAISELLQREADEPPLEAE